MYEITSQFENALMVLVLIFALMINFVHSQNQIYYKSYADTSSITQDGRIIFGVSVVKDGNTLMVSVKQTNGKNRVIHYSVKSGKVIQLQHFQNTAPAYITIPTEKVELYQSNMVAYSSKHSSFVICRLGSPATTYYIRDDSHDYKKLLYSPKKRTTAFLSTEGKIGYFTKNTFPDNLQNNVQTLQSIENVIDIQMSFDSQMLAVIDNTNNFRIFQTQKFKLFYQSQNAFASSQNKGQFIAWNPVVKPWNQLYFYKADKNTLHPGSFSFSISNSLKFNVTIQPYDKSKYEPQQMKFLPPGVGHNDLLIFASRQIEGDNKNVFFHFFDLSQNSTFTTKKQFASEVKGVQFFRNDPSKMAIFTDTQVAYYDIQFCNTDNNATEYFSSTLLTCVTCTPECQNCSEAGCTGSTQALIDDVINQAQLQENPEAEVEQNLLESQEDSDPGQTKIQKQIIQFQGLLDNVVKNNFTKSINSVPGGRRVFTIFYSMFTNFDDLWLYSYHQKHYNVALQCLFEMIQEFQDEKWELVPYAKLWNVVGIDMQNVKNVLQLKKQYTSQKFKKVQNESNGFIPNTMNYLFSNLFFTFITFVLFKLVFSLISKYKVSILIRQYSFWPTLILMALQGNIQYFSYLLTFEILTLFSRIFMYKLLYVLILCCLFMLIFGLSILFVQVKRTYKKLSKHFFNNVSTKKTAILYMTINFGIRNFIFGISHYWFEDRYFIKIIWLTCLQISFTVFNIYLLRIDTYSIQEASKKSKIYSPHIFCSKFKVFFSGVLCSFIRIILNMTLLVENNSIQIINLLNQQTCFFIQGHIFLVYTYISVCGIQVLNSTIISVKQLKASIFSIQNKHITHQQQKIISETLTSGEFYQSRTLQQKRKNAHRNLLTRLRKNTNKRDIDKKFSKDKKNTQILSMEQANKQTSPSAFKRQGNSIFVQNYIQQNNSQVIKRFDATSHGFKRQSAEKLSYLKQKKYTTITRKENYLNTNTPTSPTSKSVRNNANKTKAISIFRKGKVIQKRPNNSLQINAVQIK